MSAPSRLRFSLGQGAVAILLGVLPQPTVATPYLDAVAEHCDRFLVHGRDRYGPRHTPLFVDGLDVRLLQPATFVYGGRADGTGRGFHNKLARREQRPGERWILSNLASQADFFRVLDGLSSVTGDPRFRRGAEEALQCGLRELRARSGLLYWGGHVAYDCRRDVPVAEQTEHELKCHFPHYPLLAEVDRRRTLDFVDAFWNAHVSDWRSLDMNRHGSEFFWKPPRLRMWRRPYRPRQVPFEGRGRAFCNTACDMMAAAVFVYQSEGNENALQWAERLAQRYADARNAATGLGGRQYTTTTDDRARAQFSTEFGAIANDANILSPAMMVFRYGRLPICYLNIAEQVGGAVGDNFLRLAVEDLVAFGLHAYDSEANMIHPMFTDGRRIDLNAVARGGHYYDPADPARITKLRSYQVGGTFLWAYAMAYRLSGDRRLIPAMRRIGGAKGFGDLIAAPKLDHHSSDPESLHALLELHRATGDRKYLTLARRLGDNMLRQRRHNGFLVRSRSHRYTRCSTPEAPALLRLHAELTGTVQRIPRAWPSYPYFQCRFGDLGRVTDNAAIYKQKVRNR